jgi:hypothetical protein
MTESGAPSARERMTKFNLRGDSGTPGYSAKMFAKLELTLHNRDGMDISKKVRPGTGGSTVPDLGRSFDSLCFAAAPRGLPALRVEVVAVADRADLGLRRCQGASSYRGAAEHHRAACAGPGGPPLTRLR